MKIDLPSLINFNKDKLAPANEKLASFIVGQLPKNIMKPFMFIPTSKLNVTYQKLRDRYEYLRRLEPLTHCDPKCQEGWYWDCETETCKEYSSYIAILNDRKEFIIKAKSTYPGVVLYNEETPWWYANGESLFGLANKQSLGLQPLYTIQDFSPSWKQINSVTISSLVPTNSRYNDLANPSNTIASPYFIKTFIKVSKFDYINFESPVLGYNMDEFTFLQVYSWKIVDTFSLYGVK